MLQRITLTIEPRHHPQARRPAVHRIQLTVKGEFHGLGRPLLEQSNKKQTNYPNFETKKHLRHKKMAPLKRLFYTLDLFTALDGFGLVLEPLGFGCIEPRALGFRGLLLD